MEEVILARHGESVFSVDGLTSGDPAGCGGLTAAGQAQATRLGELLADEPIELCVTRAFRPARETAEIALRGRAVPTLVVPELNDIRFGAFEGKPLDEYRAWARSHGPVVASPGGGESRAEAARRYVGGYRVVLARPERTILVVAHGLPIRYVLNAALAQDPSPFVEQVEYAHPYRLSADELARAVDRLEAWTRAPAWAPTRERA